MNVIELDSRRKPTLPKAPVFKGNPYFCTRCDSDLFRLDDLGKIHCSGCGANPEPQKRPMKRKNNNARGDGRK